MRKSIFYYKQLTAAEVGSTGTHEIYVRLPNDFDHNDFFQSKLEENGSVLEKNFVVYNLTNGHKRESIEMRFVYFHNSNREKRIPGLGEVFKSNNVQENDVVRLESRIIDGNVQFYITFLHPNEINLSPKQFYYSIINDNEQQNGNSSNNEGDIPRQQIFYGAPGTGKSHKIKKFLEENNVPKENIYRTTFHPDSDYSTFVGVYKPSMEELKERLYTKEELIGKLTELKNSGTTYVSHKFGANFWLSLKKLTPNEKKEILQACDMSENYTVEFDKGIAIGEEFSIGKKESKIVYSFVPQVFLKAYIRAYQTAEPVYLVIEEINRGNCAQIFGDLFQLLDRNKEGYSDYTIKADEDLKMFLQNELKDESAKGIKDGELCLPPNLYIFATMNTSDQSLFPIDSAFKRRWDWEYEPIKYANTTWKIEIGEKKYSWVEFQKIVNAKIFNINSSEDKMLGDYFVNPANGIITEKVFLNKILFYLWNDVCKDGDGDIFKTADDKEITFSDLHGESGTEIMISMMEYLFKSNQDGNN